MSAATLAASPTMSTTASCTIPGALQHLLDKIEEQRNVNRRAFEVLYSLKADLESKWRTASSEGHTSSTVLYEILEYGWREWRRRTA